MSALHLPLHPDLAIVVDGHRVLHDDQADIVALPLVQNHRETPQSARPGRSDQRTVVPSDVAGQQLDGLPVRGVHPLEPMERIANNPLKGFCHNAIGAIQCGVR